MNTARVLRSRSPRVMDEPAFVLHRYDWSESSLIVDVFSRSHGRLALVAKGAKRPASQLRPILLPLQPLLLSWGGDGDIKTLKTAHWRGGHVMPVGDALLMGIYLNELLLRLIPREDPDPVLFDHYSLAVHALGTRHADPPALADAAIVRAWELLLLQACGVLPQLDVEGSNLQAIQPQRRYALLEQGGLCEAPDDERHALPGTVWMDLQRALHSPEPFSATVATCLRCADQSGAGLLQIQLRRLLHHHSGVRTFKTRQVMLDVQTLARHHAP